MMRSPSFRMRSVSENATGSPRRTRSRIVALAIVQLRRHERVDRTGPRSRPPSSRRCCSAPRFQETIVPSSCLPTIASTEFTTMAASRSVASCARTRSETSRSDDGEALARGVCGHLEPPAERGMIALLSNHMPAAHRPPIGLAERPVGAARERLPEESPHQIGGAAADQRRHRGVHVGDYPPTVDHEECIPDAGEYALDSFRLPSRALCLFLCAKGFLFGTGGLLLRADRFLLGARGLRRCALQRRGDRRARPKPLLCRASRCRHR